MASCSSEISEPIWLSKSKLAVAAQISLSYLSEIESGSKQQVRPEKIKAIADALKVNVLVLISNPNEATTSPAEAAA